ncbi:MAG: hypothetical protein V5783_07325 [Pontiella sp.]
MYSTLPSFVLGFHGCDKKVAEAVFAGKSKLKKSTNEYDWLGNGIYFWENNPQRAMEYARNLKLYPKRCSKKIREPAVVGAIIDLGNCLNLLDAKSITIVKEANALYEEICKNNDIPLAHNQPVRNSKELLLRYRDCAVIELLHASRETRKESALSSARGMFTEGKSLYKNAGFHEKNHIQICIRNPNCIKGYFRVLDSDITWPVP